MASRDVAGRLRVGAFEQIELPDGRIAKPVSGTGNHVTYDVDGERVESTSLYSPYTIQYDAMSDDESPLIAIAPRRRKRK